MIRVFYGDDRVRAMGEVKKILGDDYEVIEGVDVISGEMESVFYGASLLTPERKILIRDLGENKPAFNELARFTDTPYEVILLETKVDKRSAAYKELKDKIEFREFKLPEAASKAVFDIYKTAKRDGVQAVKMLESVKATEDPIKFTGLLVSQVLKDFAAHPGVKERRVLKELAKVDMQMKTSKIEPWLLVESFLLNLG